MKVLSPPEEPRQDELELLIREARARQRRRWLLFAAGLALAAGIGLAVSAVIPGGGSSGQEAAGGGAIAGGTRPRSLGPRAAITTFGRSDFASGGRLIWAASHSHLWFSTNGGRSWRLTSLPGLHGKWPMWRMSGADFIDPTHGWVVMYWDRRVQVDRTNDGGRTWRVSYVPDAGPAAGWDLQTPTRGYVDVGARGKRYVTRNAGATWTLLPSARPRLLRHRRGFRVIELSPKLGDWAGTLERTNDYGRHWTPLPLPDDANPQWVQSFGARLIVPTLVRGDRLAVYVSEDGGRHWQMRSAPRRINPGVPQFNFSAPALGTWYSLSGPRLFLTHDLGRTWHLVHMSKLHPVGQTGEPDDFITSRLGWALAGTRLVRTTDGGRRWVSAGPPKIKHRRNE